nr:putative ribonuclease H-like domain-containing protein [Tanacetum cinerariifolium]
MRPFGCHVTILNTLDQLGKFNGKSDEGIFFGYSTISKAFRVYNTRTRKVEENLHITFLENKPIIIGGGPEWLFDIDVHLKLMNYAPVPTCTNSNDFASKGVSFDAGQSSLETGPSQDYILIPLWKDNSLFESSSQDSDVLKIPPINTATPNYADYASYSLMHDLEDTRIFDDDYDDRDEGAEANNLETVISVSPIPFTRVHKDHPKKQIIGEMEPKKVTQALNDESWVEAMQEELLQFKLLNDSQIECTRSKKLYMVFIKLLEPGVRLYPPSYWKMDSKEGQLIRLCSSSRSRMTFYCSSMISMRELTFFLGLQVEQRTDGIFLSQDKYVCDILKKFGFSSVKSASTPMKTHKRLSKDVAGTYVNVHLYRLVAQGHRQEEGIDYDEVFAPVARIEVIRLLLAYASFMDFTMYQWNVKSAFLYGTIKEEVYVSQHPGFVDPEFPKRVYKVEKALYGLHQAPRAWYETLSTYLLENGFKRRTINKTLFINQIKNDILLVQVYVDDIIFCSTKKSLSTEFEQLMHK